MSVAGIVVRRMSAAALAAGTSVFVGTAVAMAGPTPGCTAGDITGVESQVSTAMTGYFFTHPNVNDFFTELQGLPKQEAFEKAKSYFDANPQVEDEINAMRRPVLDLRNRCNIPTTNLIRGVL